MEKIYRVQMNSKGMPNFATAEEVADRPQGWIPCSERLPSADYDVLVQYDDDSIGVDYISGTAHGWELSDYPYLPIAWMMLPEPYKEGIDDEVR